MLASSRAVIDAIALDQARALKMSLNESVAGPRAGSAGASTDARTEGPRMEIGYE
jgi:hypothetical protein